MTIMKRIEVVAAIIEKDGKIFATQRGYGEWKDWWEFPGGKMESGESSKQALVREIREELDTEIVVDSLLETVEYDYPTFHITLHAFLCHVVTGALTLLEHEDAKWLDSSTLFSVKWLPADVQIIEKLRKRMNIE
jgi:8-oxo-dGTP diphosphatase